MLSLALGMLLTGCRTDVGPSGLPGTASTPAATVDPPRPPTPDPSVAAPEPLDAACEQLVSVDALYSVNPSLAIVPAPTAEGAPFVELVTAGGVSCGIAHATAGATALLVVAEPDVTLRESLESTAGSPIAEVDGVTFYGDEFLAQAFDGARWFAVRSDPQGILQASVILTAIMGN